MAEDQNVLSEQISLLGADKHVDPFWTARLAGDEPVVGLGETFIVNSVATPTRVAARSLIPQEAVAFAGTWLAGLLAGPDDDLYRDPTAVGLPEAAVMPTVALGEMIDIALHELPPAYGDWRLSVELYVLYGRSLYLLSGELAVRSRVLAEAELGIAFGGRMLPFLADTGEEPAGPMVFLVGIPGRMAALGGLRGFRRGLLDAGRGLATLQTLSGAGGARWLWETEFFDDACARVLGVDGLERIPLAIGVQLADAEDDEPAAPAREAGS